MNPGQAQPRDRVQINTVVPDDGYTGSMEPLLLERQIDAYGGRFASVEGVNGDDSLNLLHPDDAPDTESLGFPPEGVTFISSGE